MQRVKIKLSPATQRRINAEFFRLLAKDVSEEMNRCIQTAFYDAYPQRVYKPLYRLFDTIYIRIEHGKLVCKFSSDLISGEYQTNEKFNTNKYVSADDYIMKRSLEEGIHGRPSIYVSSPTVAEEMRRFMQGYDTTLRAQEAINKVLA